MDYSIQLYSVRDAAKEDFEGTVAKMAQLGYKQVEFAGYFGRTAAQVRDMLDKNGLAVSGVHAGLQPLLDDYDCTVQFNKDIGNSLYIIPGHDLSDQAKLNAFVAAVNPLQEKLAADGITLAFHNHHREFFTQEDGSQIYDQLLYRTNLKLEVDTYWAYVGMKNPLKLLDRVGDRLVAVHLKDGDADGHGTPLGMGTAPVKDVWTAVKDRGIPLVVESETQTPDGPTEAKICIEYLKALK